MSAQSIEPHYSTPLLALVSAIMDFPAPSAATSKDYDTLIQQLNQLCPLQHFGMLGLSEAGLQWVCEYQISDSFKLQLGLEESRITDQLTQLDEVDGWCSLPVEHGQVQWLLACCQPKELPTLRLLLECLAKRLNEEPSIATPSTVMATPRSPLPCNRTWRQRCWSLATPASAAMSTPWARSSTSS